MKKKKIDKANVEDMLHLTPMQESMLFYYLSYPKSRIYYIQLELALNGDVEPLKIKKAWERTVEENEILRTVFRWKNIKRPVQIVLKGQEMAFRYIDLTLNKNVQDNLTEIKEDDKEKVIDLECHPFRILLCKKVEQSWSMILTYHHILLDGWSIGILLKEFTEHLAEQEKIKNEYGKKLKYKHYLQYLLQKDTEKEREYWRDYLGGFESFADLDGDLKGTNEKADLFGMKKVVISRELKERIESFKRIHGLTSATFFYFVWGILLSRYSNQTEVLFGTTVSGRNEVLPGIECGTGLFINTIPLRFLACGELSCLTELIKLQGLVFQRNDFESTSTNNIKQYLSWETKENLFQTIVVLDNYPVDLEAINKNKAFQIGLESMNETSQFDIMLQIVEHEALSLMFHYNYNRFSKEMVDQLCAHFIHIMEWIMAHPEGNVCEIQMLPKHEKNFLCQKEEYSGFHYPPEETLISMLERKVKEIPDATALIYKTDRMTYREFWDRSEVMANYLLNHQVSAGDIVGIACRRSFDMMIGIFGILKAGAAYLPVDSSYPEERITYIIENSGISVMLMQREYTGLFDWGVEIVCLEDCEELSLSEKKRLTENQPESMAYMIYTSGSTGKPKGVMVSHGSAVNLVYAMQYLYPADQSGALLQKTTVTFDVSVSEIFGWIPGGSKLVLLEQGDEKDPEKIIHAIRENGITHINFVPSPLQAFLSVLTEAHVKVLNRVSYIIAAGEVLTADLVQLFYKITDGPVLENLYGPTEATVYATGFSTKDCQLGEPVPIGRALPGYQAIVVDEENRLLPAWITGELCLSGTGIALGYWNNEKTTKEKFIDSPELGSIMYKTGDLAFRDENGIFYFVGRKDEQVKIRGYRIELREVEHTIGRHKDVENAAVIAVPNEVGGEIRAFVVYKKTVADKEMNAFLRKWIPDYMLPSVYVACRELPYNTRGKLDRNSLKNFNRSELVPGYRAVSGTGRRTEKRIMGIWQEVLGRTDFTPVDNFFEKGGNSLLLLSVFNRLKEEFKTEMHVTDLFKYPTVASLTSFLEPVGEKEEPDGPDILSATDNYDCTDIAIIGMAGRFPGAEDTDILWKNLCNRHEAVSEFSDEELKHISSELLKNKNYVKAGAVLEHIEDFDAAFFGYSPKEAELLDPQQRIFLECAYHALENASVSLERYEGNIAVFAGTSMNSYLLNQIYPRAGRNVAEQFQQILGSDKDYVSSRVSYKLGLSGPGITVQTACSSSLVAVHMACQSLLQDDSDIALAGAASVRVPQKEGYLYQPEGILSPDGHCRAFDIDAQGTVGGSGVAAVVLKKLNKAIEDKDFIYAVIKGSAINNDGNQKVAFTAPGVKGQMKVIEKAIKRANIHPETIEYIETHGTGTKLGDSVEISALKSVYSAYTDKKHYCGIGSVKTNIGHLDAAAGVTGLIKAVLCLKNRAFVPSLHFQKANPDFDLENSPFYVTDEYSKWIERNHPRRAAVSSFGIGGTNAHVILEEWREGKADTNGHEENFLYLLSGKTVPALEETGRMLEQAIRKNPVLRPQDIEYTLAFGRNIYPVRTYITCNTAGGKTGGLCLGEIHQTVSVNRPVVFLFPGQGSQIEQMGEKMYEESLFFREQLNHVAQLFEHLTSINYLNYIFPKSSDDAINLHQTGIAQPAMFMIEYALAAYWIEQGIEPAAMIGHSLGEYAAACIAGVLSLEDAVKLVAARAKLMQELPPGGMAAVNLTEQEIEKVRGSLSLAAVNTGSLCVLSGSNSEIDALEKDCQKNITFFRRLKTSHAFHSYMVSGMVEEFGQILDEIKLSAPKIPYISSVTGDWIRAEEVTSRQYWIAHITQPVRFATGINTLEQWDSCLYLEVGPGKTLTGLVAQNIDSAEKVSFPVLMNNRNEPAGIEQVKRLVGELWCCGARLDLDRILMCSDARKIPLPGYAFAKEPYWFGGIVSERECEYESQDSIKGIKSMKYKRPDTLGEYCAPGNCTQKVICGICEDALGIRKVGIHDDFFGLGGHSLLAVNVLAQINEIFQTELSLNSIFETPTVYGIEQQLYKAWGTAEIAESIAQICMEIDQ